MQTDLSTTITP